jgi:hypothetical protein
MIEQNSTPPPEPVTYLFNAPELARLAVYRTAVEAQFYTDWNGSEDTTDLEFLASLNTETSGQSDSFPFTTSELEVLAKTRDAFVGGYYNEE